MNKTIEVAIVMDVTGSMQTWINSAYETVLESFTTIQKENPESQLRLACICYRDFGDSQPFVISPFTTDLVSVQTLLKETRALGGDDSAEDIAGALEKTLELEWSEDATKLVLWVADAPAHGIKYHTTSISDRFPKGDPEGREPSEQVKELALKGIDFTMFRVDKSIDKMVEEFSNVYMNTKDHIQGEFEATFTLLDIVKQENKYSSPPSHSSHYDSSIISGFIDLASYDDEYSYSYKDVEDEEKDVRPSTSSPSTSSTFRSATEEAIRKTISKRSS